MTYALTLLLCITGMECIWIRVDVYPTEAECMAAGYEWTAEGDSAEIRDWACPRMAGENEPRSKIAPARR
jgi:hypothetical protein